MLAPVLVAPPEQFPVSLDAAKLHLRVDHDDDDVLIASLIQAAIDHLDGWNGILGRCLAEQTWRQDFDTLAPCLPLPLGPVIEIVSVDYVDINAQARTLSSESYSLRIDAGGRAQIDLTSWPSSISASATYRAGYVTIPETPADGESPAIPAESTVPAAIKTAITMLVGHWYANREATMTGVLSMVPMAIDALVSPYRRVGV